jgi:hypothetical protein
MWSKERDVGRASWLSRFSGLSLVAFGSGSSLGGSRIGLGEVSRSRRGSVSLGSDLSVSLPPGKIVQTDVVMFEFEMTGRGQGLVNGIGRAV